ncbi:uncharacterized protein LOC128960262 [Oppia nitens]|uniref:uncharacterized protein LOC128960262 n=1 Tax=Oppia nitens TaxID=1686743 RepID=UPI0023DBA6B6|nr:uncharacterized protein LOC128960262 [Oppia nitens]
MFKFIAMVPLVSFLAALRILTEAQSCNNGLGKLVYEKVVDYKLNGNVGFGTNQITKEVITKNDEPIKVLEECIRRCQEDRLTTIANCLSFDFSPGRRRSSPFKNPPEYETSSCTLYNDRGSPDGEETLVKEENYWHYNEVCLTSAKVSTQCPNRLYIFERIPGYKLQMSDDKEFTTKNRTECEDKCLNEMTFVCRSASYNRKTSKCRLSTETRYINPQNFKVDPNSDYLENMCIQSGSEMCSWSAFILETAKQLDAIYERTLITANEFNECSNACFESLDKNGFLCRAFAFDETGQTCILYDEDPLSYEEITSTDSSQNQYKTRQLKPSAANLYRFLCASDEKDRSGSGIYPHSYASHLYEQRAGFHSGAPGIASPEAIYGGTGGTYQPWNNGYQGRDHHRGGFSYDEYGPGGYTSRRGFTSNYASPNRYPGYGVPPYGSFSQNMMTHTSHPISTIGGSASGSGSGSISGQSSQMPPTYGIPYNVGSGGSYNSIQAPYPPQKGTDLCKYSSVSSVGPPVTARFSRIGFSSRLRSQYVFKVVRADKLEDCERACTETRDFVCKSFNFRAFFPDNCELSHFDSKEFKYDNPTYFEHNSQYDYYERSDIATAPGGPTTSADCMEVTQTCTPEGMEFSLRTSESFYGRIYTYGFYDSCFYDGNGGTTSLLRISRANGFPRCGTQQYGDAMTNIVVVQFNDYVQTSRDKKYNLTCFFSGPGEAVVTSNYLDTKTDGRHPTQIEHLPAQNILTSNVVLRVLYRGTPTNTIVVGDLLTFRLEARSQYRYDLYNNDIFAANVIAKDPYTGRQVHLVDSKGCPVDLYVFPELHKTPDGALEAEFYAFKIPDSNFLVFQATVRTCRGPCEPVICNDRGRGSGSFPSWGRRKRSVNSTKESTIKSNFTEEADEVHELLRVYLSREDVPPPESKPQINPLTVSSKICVPHTGYYMLVTVLTILTSILMIISGTAALVYFKRSKSETKSVDILKPKQTNGNFYVNALPPTQSMASHHKFEDPSEPIYTDPSLFERSRSLRSVTTVSNFANIGCNQ